MPTFVCPDCSHTVSTSAVSCPHCGRPVVSQQDKKNTHENTGIIKWLCFIIVGVAVLIGTNIPTKDKEVQGTGQISKQARLGLRENLEHVRAVQLVDDYKSNEVAADAQWKGRYIVVFGVISQITKSISGAPVIAIRGTNEFHNVRVTLDKREMQAAASLAQYRTIWVAGTVKGYSIGSVLVDNGIIVQD